MKENHDSHTGLQDFISLGLQEAGNDIILKHETYKDCLLLSSYFTFCLFLMLIKIVSSVFLETGICC